MAAERKTVRLKIFGQVQGVFYRAWTVGEATKRGLDGWVRNRFDGSVEAVISGPAAKVDELVAACRTGPPRAQVSRVNVGEVDESEARGPGFRQSPTV
ncbi:MAG: acylphosphatase [Alphaproteobacteria bacterium]